MARISLRAYMRRIDELIEHEQLDEAIAHCGHILQTYSKHIDTYRLLAKAYLEAKRYGDAADIFQRVLSAIPDDFVSHIGMAIIREDEGNIDAAIWHMERAFDTNPSNPSIQQELRRLIGRRDGIEPQKVRLTRGALARMYARGELHQQAIAELRAALEDDAERPDLQVLLAQLYWRTGNMTEAAQVSLNLLEKLPYCQEANRIIAAILQSRDQIEESAVYHRRLAALDPYASLVKSAKDDPRTVDDEAIRLERLEWQPGRPISRGPLERPEWAASLEASLATEAEQPEEVPEAARPPSPTPPEEPLPDWMKEIGWTEANGEPSTEEPVSFTDEELERLEGGKLPPPEEEPAAPTQFPEWLKDIAPGQPGPPQGAPALPAEGAEEEISLPEWLRDLEATEASGPPPSMPAEPSQVEAPQGQSPEDEFLPSGEQIGEVPSWLDETPPGASASIVSWLSEVAREGPAITPEEIETPSAEEQPAQAAEIAEEEMPAEAAEEEEPAGPPSWLKAVAEAAAQEEAPSEEELAEFLQQSTAEVEEVAAEMGDDAAPDWLREIAETPLETESLAEAEDAEEVGAETPESTQTIAEEPAAIGEAEAGLPSAQWMIEFAEQARRKQTPAEEAPPAPSHEAEEIPEDIFRILEPKGAPPAAEVAPPEALAPEEPAPAPPAEQARAEEELPPITTPPEALAPAEPAPAPPAEQARAEEELPPIAAPPTEEILPEAEEQLTAAPEEKPTASLEESGVWLRALAETDVADEIPEPFPDVSALERVEHPAEGLIAPVPEQAMAEGEVEEEKEDLSWLTRLSEERGIEMAATEEEERPPALAEEEQLVPDWLRKIMAEAQEAQEPSTAAEPEGHEAIAEAPQAPEPLTTPQAGAMTEEEQTEGAELPKELQSEPQPHEMPTIVHEPIREAFPESEPTVEMPTVEQVPERLEEEALEPEQVPEEEMPSIPALQPEATREALLAKAQQDMEEGRFEEALAAYLDLLRQETGNDRLIDNLKQAIDRLRGDTAEFKE